MESEGFAWWPVLLIVAIVLPYLGGMLWLKRLVHKRRAQAEALYADKPVILMEAANYFGQKALGGKQTRGLGLLVLQQHTLSFERFLPRMSLHIPLARVSRVSTPRWFNGKSVLKPLLVINYRNSGGVDDAVGFYVKNLSDWAESIQVLAEQAEPA